MPLTSASLEFIENLDQHNDITALIDAFRALMGKFGLACFLIGDPTLPATQHDYATVWPQSRLTHWLSQNRGSAEGPVERPRAARRSMQAAERILAGTNICNEPALLQRKDGFSLPIYSRDGFVIGISKGPSRQDLDRQDEACLYLASIYFHARLERLRAERAPRPNGPRMTPRERECLSWVAAGKTDWEISQILSISEQTTHEYVQNALTKLNAATRAQAVAIALLTRQILA